MSEPDKATSYGTPAEWSKRAARPLPTAAGQTPSAGPGGDERHEYIAPDLSTLVGGAPGGPPEPSTAPDDGGDAPGVAPSAGVEKPPFSAWSRIPLRGRLPIIFSALLLVALVITGVVTHITMSNYMLGQIDSQLREAVGRPVARGPQSALTQNQGAPTDYVQWYFDADGDLLGALPISLTESDELARPDFSGGVPTASAGSAGEPFTVLSQDGSTQWRVVVSQRDYGVVSASGTSPSGTAATGFPLTQVNDALRTITWVFVWAGLAVAALGSVIGYWAVRRALRPLKAVGHTAARIAAGDLTQRVAPAPPGTEVGELSQSLNTMLGQIEQSFAIREASEARMRQFISDASHELRTPLAAIRGYGELYRMGALADSEELSGAMRRIESEATRMGSLVHDLLQLTRLDEGAPLRRERVDLAVLAADAAADLRALDPTREVTVTSPGPVECWGDPDRLRQVLANLIGNAARYTPEGSRVEIVVTSANGLASLAVIDHGPGISSADAERVFERFTRLESSRARLSGGAGLGLAIVASIAAAHGGSVTLGPTPGGGATFAVTLPATASIPAEPPASKEAGCMPPGPWSRSTGPGYVTQNTCSQPSPSDE